MKDALGQDIHIGSNVLHFDRLSHGFDPKPRKVIGTCHTREDYVIINLSDYSHVPKRKMARLVLVVDKLIGDKE